MEQQLQDRRAEALHPFSSDPWGRHGASSRINAIVVALVIVIGIVAIIFAT